MRRQWAIAALCTAILVAPAWAQMHGGSRGSAMGGSRSSAAMGRGGFSSRGSFGIRSGPGFAASPRFGAGFGTGLRRPFFGPRQPFVSVRQPFFGPRRFRSRIFFPATSPFFFGYYGAPGYFGDYSYSTLDSYPVYDSYAYSAQNDVAQQQQLQQQQEIDRLESEVALLREQRESREAAPPRPPVENKSEPSTPTLLVFRDKHTQEVQNYAVVGGTLWIFSEQRATKLPLSWLDIEATAKANEDRGVDFQVPK